MTGSSRVDRDAAVRRVVIPCENAHLGCRELDGTLATPHGARAIVVFVHGSGSSRLSRPDRFVARALGRSGYATLLFDLLAPEEVTVHEMPRRTPFTVETLAPRVIAATRWLERDPVTRRLRVGYFGAGTGAAAALIAAAALQDRVGAVVTRAGRPDLVDPATLGEIPAPVLLLVSHRDRHELAVNRQALAALRNARLELVPGASGRFGERGALAAVALVTAEWLARHLRASGAAEDDVVRQPAH
jgi:putative phosphoribosyl transferase